VGRVVDMARKLRRKKRKATRAQERTGAFLFDLVEGSDILGEIIVDETGTRLLLCLLGARVSSLPHRSSF
jgi:hypothetical protein